MIYLFLACGFEEIEAITPLDIMKRCGLPIRTVSITQEKEVEGAHGITITADMNLTEADFENAQVLILPGGMPGAANLLQNPTVSETVRKHNEAGKLLCAICAAPMVLGQNGCLEGKKATCYPGFEQYLNTEATGELVSADRNVITGRGPGAAFEFSFAIVERLLGKEKVEQLKKDMMF